MKFEDKNFEREFENWLSSKTEEDLVETFKKYSINNEMEVKTNENTKNNK